MSNAARFPEPGHSRHPGSAGYPSSWARPTPGPQRGREASISGSVVNAGMQPRTNPRNHDENADDWGRPAGHVMPWAGKDFALEENTPSKAVNNPWANLSEGTAVDVVKNYPPLENLSRHIDHQQKRQKWREELLKGDPEKAIKASLPEASRLVVTFITRGPPDSHGQGTEIMRFRPPSRASHFPTVHDWTYFAIDGSLLAKNKKEDVVTNAVELSKRPLAYMLPKLDVKKDLKLVRKSKPLLWDNSTVLESFIYRIVGKKEDPESAAGKELTQRLGGPALHGWCQTSEIQSLLMGTDSDLVSTALNAVFFPPRLSASFDSISADRDSPPEKLALKALETLYLCVQLKHARLAFKFYPIPQPSSGDPELALCDKRRVWAYWTEVLAWHLSKLREDAQASISYALLKSLSAVKDSVDDAKVTLDELESIMVTAIANEADRSRYATSALINEAACECLHNPNFSPSEKSLNKMHIFTAGDSPVVFGVLSNLINHILASEKILAGSSLQTVMKKKVLELKITIAEGRPLSKGVVLATKLARVVDLCIEHRESASKGERFAPSASDGRNSLLGPSTRSQLIKATPHEDQTHNPMRLMPHSLGLSELLADLDSKKEKKDSKVTIEVITDAAAVCTTMASHGSGAKPIILLNADCILPNGNSVNEVGAAQMAWAGKCSGGVVLILCRTDQIHPKGLPAPSKSKLTVNQLKSSWKPLIPEESLRTLQSSSLVKITNPTYEHIDHKNITGYITELGLMKNHVLKEFLNTRGNLEKVVWPVNDLTK